MAQNQTCPHNHIDLELLLDAGETEIEVFIPGFDEGILSELFSVFLTS